MLWINEAAKDNILNIPMDRPWKSIGKGQLLL